MVLDVPIFKHIMDMTATVCNDVNSENTDQVLQR